jgi:hypothetical protein
MKAFAHVTAGRTAIRALLIAVMSADGLAGTVGTAAVERTDGKANEPYPADLYASLDGKGNDVHPPRSIYQSRTAGIIDGTGNDATINAFSVDNVTAFAATYATRGGGSRKAGL